MASTFKIVSIRILDLPVSWEHQWILTHWEIVAPVAKSTEVRSQPNRYPDFKIIRTIVHVNVYVER